VTPGTFSKSASVHQKQPPAKVATDSPGLGFKSSGPTARAGPVRGQMPQAAKVNSQPRESDLMNMRALLEKDGKLSRIFINTCVFVKEGRISKISPPPKIKRPAGFPAGR
jgi:hypothetical protein